MLNKLVEFLKQDKETEAYIVGPAGSGKTTLLTKLVNYLDDIPYIITTYTHTAKNVIISKGLKATTLHSFLKKRPIINRHAKKLNSLNVVTQVGIPKRLELLIVDEFSFIGEKDYQSICDLQDWYCQKCDEILYGEKVCDVCGTKGLPPIKVIFIGDTHQLPPVGDIQAVEPRGEYIVSLDKIYRNSFKILSKLRDMIDNKIPVSYLEPDKYVNMRNIPGRGFFRPNKGKILNLSELYKKDKSKSKKVLSYTNKNVQLYNSEIQGRDFPIIGDMVYDSTLKKEYEILDIVDKVHSVDVLTISGIINDKTRYNPLKFLNKLKEVKYFITDIGIIPVIFGSYNNKILREKIAKQLISLNREKKDSKKVYQKYKLIQDYVSNVDFTHCITVHKAQGNEWDNIYIDVKSFDISTDKLKLLYVALSRSKKRIIFNF